jgi:hypothetical protein
VGYIETLQDAVRQAHGSDPNHIRSVPVKEVFRGQTIWEGTVEVFELTGHPRAKLCYAWGFYPDDKTKEMRIITALGVPPVDSPLAAVRASITGGCV